MLIGMAGEQTPQPPPKLACPGFQGMQMVILPMKVE